METIHFQGFYESDCSDVGNTSTSAINREYFMYDFQERDLDYNWIPLYYSFVEPWDYEPHLKLDNLKSVTNYTTSVNTDHNESGPNDGVVRKHKKTRRGHAAGKRKPRGEKRRNVNAEVSDQPNAKRAKKGQDINTEEQENMAVVLGGLDLYRQPEAPEEEVPICWSWEKRGRGL